MKKLLLALFLTAAATPASAMLALPAAAPAQWTMTVNATMAGAPLTYTTNVWVHRFAAGYKAKLYAVGPYVTGPGTAWGFADVIAKEPAAVVFNGGYWDNDPYVPAGYLRVGSKTFHQLDFSKTTTTAHDFGQSAILCLSAAGGIEPLQTQDFVAPTAHIADRCGSALQAGPFVVRDSANGIRAFHARDFAVRTILGFDANKLPVLVVFQQPVHLMAAAEFLLAPPGTEHQVRVTNGSKPDTLHSSSGLGLVSAVNLNGGAGVACYVMGQRVAGASSVAIPSALAIQ